MDLDGLLAQVGHPNRNRVRNDVNALVRQYGSLTCRLGKHIANDGSEQRLLTVEGTLPINYKGNTYNIPVELLVSAAYPAAAPLCFVRPVKGMEVKRGHRAVAMDGAVSLPYLHSWSSLSHALVSLADALIACFSLEPPVFAVKPPSPSTASSTSSSSSSFAANTAGDTATRSRAHTSATTAGAGAAGGAGGAAYGSDAAARHRAHSHSPPPVFTPPPPPYHASNPPTSSNGATSTPPPLFSSSSSAGEDRQSVVLQEATRKVQSHLREVFEAVGNEVQDLYAQHDVLSHRAQSQETSVEALTKHKAQLESALHDANTAHVALDGWLAERASAAATAEEEEKEEAEKARSNGSGNGNSSSSNGGASSNSYSSASYSHSGSHSTNNEELKVHSALAPADPCSAKMLSLVSEAAALDDTLYALDRGLQAQAIPLELFLKQVRSLSKQKFLCMTHMEKITGQQQQRQSNLNGNRSSTSSNTMMMGPPEAMTSATAASSASSSSHVGGVSRAFPPASPMTNSSGGQQPPPHQHPSHQHGVHPGLPVPKYPTRAELDR